MNISASRGVAVREFVLDKPHGRADYLLFVDGKAVGVVEAKKAGATLTGVETQIRQVRRRPARPESRPGRGRCRSPTRSPGVETRFTNRLDPTPAAATVFTFHRPERWRELVHEPESRDSDRPTLRSTAARRCRRSTPMGLWPAQERAIRNLERSLAHEPPPGADPDGDRRGKTFTAAQHRLPAHQVRRGPARPVPGRPRATSAGRRSTSSRSSSRPDDGRKFTELYNVQHLALEHDRPRRPGRITTIQRLYSMLKGEPSSTRSSTSTRVYDLAPDGAAAGRSTTRPSRSRPSTSSSSTSATARSTTSGGRCSNTSTPS